MSGRKSFPVWVHFDRIRQLDKKGDRARCKYCHLEIQAQVSRMQVHFDKCAVFNKGEETTSVGSVGSAPSSSTSQSKGQQQIKRLGSNSGSNKGQSELRTRSDGDFVHTSQAYKHVIDKQLAMFFFATNTPFRHVEHSEFKKLCDLLRPGYCPPNRKILGTNLLDEVHESVQQDCEQKFANQTVTMTLDGWSNVNNEPIVACSIVNSAGHHALVESIDTSGHAHDAEYLKSLAMTAISSCEEKYKVRIGSFVTDNTGNVTKMRRELEKEDNVDTIQYGCSSHILELLSKDLKVQSVEGPVLKIIKYFRNTHPPAAWYKQAGGKKLIVPHAVRWNSMTNSIESFLKNRGTLVQECHNHRGDIEADIYRLVNDLNLVNNADDYCRRLKPIGVALDRMQRDKTTIAVAVEVWYKLQNDLKNEPTLVQAKLNSRQDIALGPVHYLANMMDHRFRGSNLTESQKNKAYAYLKEVNDKLLPVLMSHCSEDSLISETLYGHTFRTINPTVWWKSVVLKEDQGICDWAAVKVNWIRVCEQLLTANASTAGLERIFSTFGFVQSKLRNRLGNRKAAELTFIFKWLNQDSNKKKKGLEWIWEEMQASIESDEEMDQDDLSIESDSECIEIEDDEPPPKRRSQPLQSDSDSDKD